LDTGSRFNVEVTKDFKTEPNMVAKASAATPSLSGSFLLFIDISHAGSEGPRE
jgi:hypothetical protein